VSLRQIDVPFGASRDRVVADDGLAAHLMEDPVPSVRQDQAPLDEHARVLAIEADPGPIVVVNVVPLTVVFVVPTHFVAPESPGKSPYRLALKAISLSWIADPDEWYPPIPNCQLSWMALNRITKLFPCSIPTRLPEMSLYWMSQRSLWSLKAWIPARGDGRSARSAESKEELGAMMRRGALVVWTNTTMLWRREALSQLGDSTPHLLPHRVLSS
jgi:hypothetical protein